MAAPPGPRPLEGDSRKASPCQHLAPPAVGGQFLDHFGDPVIQVVSTVYPAAWALLTGSLHLQTAAGEGGRAG